MARIAALLLFACALHAQSVDGTVTSRTTHAPISGATVQLKGAATYRGLTDANGAFHIPDVKPGEYTVEISARGFLDLRKTHRVGTTPAQLSLELSPTGTFHGRVLFPDGTPAERAEVTLMIAHAAVGGYLTRTDAQGRFSLEIINGGRYRLVAYPPASAKAPEGEAWAPTNYGDVVLRLGADASGYDVRLRTVPVRRIRGIVRDDTGRPAPGVSLELAENGAMRRPDIKTVTDAEGAFAFDAIRTGDWRIIASLTRGGIDLKAIEGVNVGARDLDHVEIRLTRPFTLHGFVERDEPREADGKRKVSGVSLKPEAPRFELGYLQFHEQDGTIALKNVYPGRYELVPYGFKPGFYLDSVKLGDRDVLGQRVELFEGVPPLRVVYKPGAPTARFRVDRGAGATVALVPQDEALLTDQFIRTATADAEGRCEIGSLRPGDYYAFAFAEFERFALEDPAFVRGLVPRAEKLHVEKGETATVELKVTPWPE